MKTYLKAQDRFKDYDFDASDMSILLDILSYNTFQNSFYMNMLGAEAFLDSAQMRESIVSHAKELNYLPRSAISSMATINLTFTTNESVNSIILPKGLGFNAVIGTDGFQFTLPETLITTNFTQEVDSSNNVTNEFVFNNVNIFEGSYVQESFIMDYTDTEQRFIISNPNIDISSLVVNIYEDNGQTVTPFLLSNTLLDVKSATPVYFLQGAENAKYEMVFGDGVLGRKPKDQAAIVLQYRNSSGESGNGAKAFNINSDPTNGNLEGGVQIDVVSGSQGGASPESISSIKYYAPRHFQVQEKATVPSDYEILLKNRFPEINAVSAYGGELASPPKFGKVFVVVDISNVDGFPDAKKTEYYNYLKARSPLSLDPVFIEPTFLYYEITSKVNYNINVTVISADEIKTLVTNAILNYNEVNLDDFNSTLRFSKMVNAIDTAHASIVSNESDLRLYKKLNPSLTSASNYVIDFNVPLLARPIVPFGTAYNYAEDHTVVSMDFTLNGDTVRLEDDGMGKISIVKTIGKVDSKIADVGTVDYDTGRVLLNQFKIDLYQGNAFKIYAIPRSKDITSSKSDILTIDPDEIHISIAEVRE